MTLCLCGESFSGSPKPNVLNILPASHSSPRIKIEFFVNSMIPIHHQGGGYTAASTVIEWWTFDNRQLRWRIISANQ